MAGLDEPPEKRFFRGRTSRRRSLFKSVSSVLAVLLVLYFSLYKAGISGRYSSKRDGTRGLASEKATLVMLVRNQELSEALKSMRQIEDRFNRVYKYPWTFLNDEPFDEVFMQYTSGLASGPTEYGVIEPDTWRMPAHIDRNQFDKARNKMVDQNVIYGGSESYRLMCRFNSGFFFRHPALAKYDWYWRVEPSISFHCDVNYDPFTFMRENGKKYGFVIALPEYRTTIETLWSTTQAFFRARPEYLAKDNSLPFITDDAEKGIEGAEYNNCHFWSNFEIGDLNFWRSDAYLEYFNFLDATGGFFYERWGDAPVHSLAAALLLSRSELHHFSDFGYYHVPWDRCPADEESHASGRCICNREDSFDTNGWSCLPKWWRLLEAPHYA